MSASDTAIHDDSNDELMPTSTEILRLDLPNSTPGYSDDDEETSDGGEEGPDASERQTSADEEDNDGKEHHHSEGSRSRERKPLDFSSLTSSYISKPVHEAIISHYLTCYPNGLNVVPKGGRDEFLQHYMESYCDTVYFEGCRTKWPPWFLSVFEEFLMFFVQSLNPFFLKTGCFHLQDLRFLNEIPYAIDPNRHPVKQDARVHCKYLLMDFGWSDSSLVRRFESGLMRKQQMLLISILIRQMISQLSILLCIEKSATGVILPPRKEEVIWKLSEANRITARALAALSYVLQIRSERFEIMVFRYLEEEEANEEVIRGLERAQRMHENAIHEGRAESLYGTTFMKQGWLDVSLLLPEGWGDDSSDGGNNV
ncbi:hypothetical protein BJ508DRAFT_331290 [Ascobolus immersus RN42]|uniref:Uncharacterized protein n=1 Tax=Ascobolus immersus RN42 TaxID=1160509 RepID=A0A3N4HR60_ASCIM|nr:hypothetical protein BJ508DRAFT_331290 [Ascobolus immersus RN42]